jgi:hypothetical protein
MNLNDSTVVTTSEPGQDLSDFIRGLQYQVYQTAALANAAKALAFEIDEDANNPVIRVLRIVQSNLENLAAAVDEYDFKQSQSKKARG